MGTNKLKVLGPAFPNDRISLEIEIVDKKVSSKGDKVFTTWKFALKNQDETVIFEGDNTCMHRE